MRKFVVLLLFVSIASTAVAQSGTPVVINPVAGLNFSTLSDPPSGFTSKGSLGWQFGGNLRLGGKIFLQPGLQIAQFGSELSRDDINPFNTDTFKTTLTMLRIPLLAGVQFLDTQTKDAVNWNMHAGFAIEMVLGTTGLLTTDDINTSLFSAVIGAGVDIYSVTLDIDYELGLSKFYKDSGRFSTNTKNNVLLISLGWKTVL
jgi:hypothetical protein